MRAFRLSKAFLLLLVFLLPLNLGLHFELKDSYVWGLLIDYLVPTLFVQDILVVFLLVAWFLENRNSLPILFYRVLKEWRLRFLIFFLFTVFLSCFVAERFIPSIYGFGRLFLYSVLSIYIYFEVNLREDGAGLAKVFLLSVSLVAILGIAQFFMKGSVFDNYLFFGEQPYSSATPFIAKERLFGSLYLPAYGLFRHPNVFAAFLVCAILLGVQMSTLKKIPAVNIALMLCLIALMFTFSYFGWIALLLGLLLLKLKNLPGSLFWIMLTFPVFLLWLGNNYLGLLPSIERRVSLFEAAVSMVNEKPLFGFGYNTSTVHIESYIQDLSDVRFTQPIHSVFALIAAESGVLALIFFLLFLYLSYVSKVNRVAKVLFLVLIFLGGFDHYFLTAHQAQLLLLGVVALHEV